MQVGPKIRRIRKEKGMTQTELGKAISVSQRNISDLESGKTRPRTEIINQIAEVLEVASEELLAWGPTTGHGAGAGEAGQMLSPFVLPLRGTVPLARFEWPERLMAPVQFVGVPEDLYEGQRLILRAGDSSMEPEIRLHDLCVFDPSMAPVHGSIVCAQISQGGNSSCTVRWYLDTVDAIVLNPENMQSTDADSMVLVRHRGGTCRYLGQEVRLEIKGVLVGLIRSYAVPR